MPILTNELIDAILRVVNVNAFGSIPPEVTARVVVLRDMLVATGCIHRGVLGDYVRSEDYVETPRCVSCEPHGDWGSGYHCPNCRI